MSNINKSSNYVKIQEISYKGYKQNNITVPKIIMNEKKWKKGIILKWIINKNGNVILKEVEEKSRGD